MRRHIILFDFFFSFDVFMGSCACKRSWRLKRSKSAPTEAPLSHRKQSSWNTSSVVQPLIVWLCYITVHHHVTHLHEVFPVASLARKNWFSTAALSLLAVSAQACVSWPIRTYLVFRKGGLKETGAKTERFRQRGNTTPNYILNLKMSIICLLWVSPFGIMMCLTAWEWRP